MKDSTTLQPTDVTVILPSLNPDEKLIHTVNSLLEKGFHDILVVNDGSDKDHLAPFETISSYKECTILLHEENYGKGHALKTAMRYCMEHRPNSPGVITIDGDGQHHADDIYACAEAMLREKDSVILGVRDFSEPQVPFKSRYGNNITKAVFRYFCGIRISDTQTGLRAIPSRYLDAMLKFRGERFEYETNMLLEMKENNIPFLEVKIKTIYLDDNASTHFHPFRDSFKIYAIILKFGASSGIAALIELLIFSLVSLYLDFSFPTIGIETSILIATFISRLISSLCNYTINRRVVFCSGTYTAIVRYFMLCAVQLLTSAALLSLLCYFFSADTSGKILLKVVVDTFLFFISFRIQKEWVFKKK